MMERAGPRSLRPFAVRGTGSVQGELRDGPALAIGVIFARCVAVIICALAYVTTVALRLDRIHAQVQHASDIEENVRLALWRMDSVAANLRARGNSRPYFVYNAFYLVEQAYTRMFAQLAYGEVQIPSPILTGRPDHVVLHFQFAPDGDLSSPQAPTGNMRDLAETGYATPRDIIAATERLAAFGKLVGRPSLENALAGQVDQAAPPVRSPRTSDVLTQKTRTDIEAKNKLEYEARSLVMQQQVDLKPMKAGRPDVDVVVHNMRAVWMGRELLFVRRVEVDADAYLQGCWVDWSGLQMAMLKSIGDLWPGARLVSVGQKEVLSPSRTLTLLPVKLVLGEVRVPPVAGWSPVRVTLVVAWVSAIVAAVAVALLLVTVVLLSERRAAFVSAVTHELRTPLTTFRRYVDILDVVGLTEAKRRRYTALLRGEAARLGHLVANVLAYARLERNASTGPVATLPLDEVMARVGPRLTELAKKADFRLIVQVDESVGRLCVRTDVSVVEQVLLNLVDNACKYARGASDRRICLTACRKGATAEVRVHDHGPGIGPPLQGRLFRPFAKSAQDAANSAAGVGLGLCYRGALPANWAVICAWTGRWQTASASR